MGLQSNKTHRQPGFTLIEVVVVMLIFTIVIAMAAVLTRGISAAQKRSVTATRIAAVDTALILFVQQQKRLPCPADGTVDSAGVNPGLERGGGAAACTANQQNGVVPWRTLGLTETDATDGWDRRLTYRVGPLLALTGGMDMSGCDPAGTEVPIAPAAGRACNVACTAATPTSCTPPSAFLPAKGLPVRDNSGVTILMDPNATPHTGAAYVMLSAGESGGGAYLRSGTLGTSTVGDGTQELKNYASLPYTPAVTYYVDNAIIDIADPTHFDDVVSRPTVMSVASKAGLGPRAH
jgi:prepilin-type N-terminal cleavage/methylation domain-containing protein